MFMTSPYSYKNVIEANIDTEGVKNCIFELAPHSTPSTTLSNQFYLNYSLWRKRLEIWRNINKYCEFEIILIR